MYKQFILDNMPRVLTQIDRDKHSTTYGSCDRNHWHLKIRDFSSAILQQSGLALAICYKLDFDGNIYYNNENVKDWAIATVDYWAKIQLRDGSYNEYYPWEHGFPPTAFSLYSACEVCKRLKYTSDKISAKIRKTCKYLSEHIEEHAFNQEMASITALYSAYTLLGDTWILTAAEKKLERILSLQSGEGWFPEYGGADLGYLSVCFDMLCEYYHMSNDAKVYEPMQQAMSFIQYFIHPDGTVGGEYGSRNTTYFLPNGLQVLACNGVGIAERAIEVLFGDTRRSDYFMNSTDDRYFSHYLIHSCLRALEKRQGGTICAAEPLPFEYSHNKVFQEAGLISFTNDKYSTFISMKKGGLIKLYVDGVEKVIDCGYRINYGKGCVAVTNWIDQAYGVVYDNDVYSVSGNFNKIKLKVPSPILNMGLRGVAFVFGNKIIKFLKKAIIFVDKHDDVSFSRKIELNADSVVMHDEVFANKPFTLERASNMSMRHVASGKFYMSSDLLVKTGVAIQNATKFTQKTVFDIDENTFSCHIVEEK